MAIVAPPPVKEPFGTQRWIDWFVKINNQINLVAEDHNNLGNIQGGSSSERYHLTAAQHTAAIALTGAHNSLSSIQGGSATERYHLTESQHDNLTGDSIVLPSHTVAGVPTAGDHTGGIIYVTDEVDGATIAFSDGTDWRRVQDRAVIST